MGEHKHRPRSARRVNQIGGRRPHEGPGPIGAAQVVEWPEEMPREMFVGLVDQSVERARDLGYTVEHGGAQIAAWLESPARGDRVRASVELAKLRSMTKPEDD